MDRLLGWLVFRGSYIRIHVTKRNLTNQRAHHTTQTEEICFRRVVTGFSLAPSGKHALVDLAGGKVLLYVYIRVCMGIGCILCIYMYMYVYRPTPHTTHTQRERASGLILRWDLLNARAAGHHLGRRQHRYTLASAASWHDGGGGQEGEEGPLLVASGSEDGKVLVWHARQGEAPVAALRCVRRCERALSYLYAYHSTLPISTQTSPPPTVVTAASSPPSPSARRTRTSSPPRPTTAPCACGPPRTASWWLMVGRKGWWCGLKGSDLGV